MTYFVYTFWNRNCRAAPTEYDWQHPGCSVTTYQNVYRILRDIGSFLWVNALEKTVFWMQCSKTHTHYVHGISIWTGIAPTQVCRILYTVDLLSISPPKSTKHFTGRSYQLYAILWVATNSAWHSLHRWLSWHMTVVKTQRILTLRCRKIHTKQYTVIFSRGFWQPYGLEY